MERQDGNVRRGRLGLGSVRSRRGRDVEVGAAERGGRSTKLRELAQGAGHGTAVSPARTRASCAVSFVRAS